MRRNSTSRRVHALSQATAVVVGKKLDADRDRELIEDAIKSLDFSRLEEPV